VSVDSPQILQHREGQLLRLGAAGTDVAPVTPLPALVPVVVKRAPIDALAGRLKLVRDLQFGLGVGLTNGIARNFPLPPATKGARRVRQGASGNYTEQSVTGVGRLRHYPEPVGRGP